MKVQKKKSNKITVGWRLDPRVVKAIRDAAKEHEENETWVVERILGIALGVRTPPKPLPINEKIEIA